MRGPLVLVGFMGSGKSAVGRVLAERLGWRQVDLDRVIEEEAGRTIAGIFEEEGEEGFREREARALRAALGEEGTVLSCGGGVVLREENREALLSRPWVFRLCAGAETVLARVAGDEGRPLLRVSDPERRVRELMEERERWYARFEHQVETDGRTPEEVAARILEVLA